MDNSENRGSQEVTPDEPRRRSSARVNLPHPLPGLAVTIGRNRLVRTDSLEGKEAALQYFALQAAATAAASSASTSPTPTTPSPVPLSLSAPTPSTTSTALPRADLTTSSASMGSSTGNTGTTANYNGVLSPKASTGSQLFRLLQSQSREERWAALVQKMDSEQVDMKQLKREIRKGGIPAQYRGQVWLFTSGAKTRLSHNQSVYKDLLKMDPKLSPSTPLIEKDLKRSLPEAMGSDDVIAALRRVLIAYSHYNPEIGYCQSMNFICAIMLLFMNEEEAFWLLSVIVEHFMTNYLSETMLGVLADARVFKELLAQRSPKLVAHLEKLSVLPDPFVCKWFLSLFINCMPFECTLRFLDSYLLEGYKILLRVTLALFRLAEKRFLACSDFEPAYLLVTVLPTKAPAAHVLFHHAFDRLFVGSLPASKLNKMKEQHLAILHEEKKDVIERAQIRCENRRLEYERLLASLGTSPSPESTSPNTPSSTGSMRDRSLDIVSGTPQTPCVSVGNSPSVTMHMHIPTENSGNPLFETQQPASPRKWSPRTGSPHVGRAPNQNLGGSRNARSPNLSPQRPHNLLPSPSAPSDLNLEAQIDPSFRARFRPLSFLVKGTVVHDDAFDLGGLSPRSSSVNRDAISIDQSS